MTESSGEVLVLDHVIAAARSRVWSALTEPEPFSRWFGPRGWSVDPGSVRIDARVGGLQSFAMHDDDVPSVVSSVTARFVEVEPGVRLVSTETVYGAGATDSMSVTLAITLSDVPEGTLLALEQGPFPEGVDDLALQGWLGSLRRLEELLATG